MTTVPGAMVVVNPTVVVINWPSEVVLDGREGISKELLESAGENRSERERIIIPWPAIKTILASGKPSRQQCTLRLDETAVNQKQFRPIPVPNGQNQSLGDKELFPDSNPKF